MRLIGILLAIGGVVGLVYSVRATLERGRPTDVLFALLSWAAVLISLLGLTLVFVPGFLG